MANEVEVFELSGTRGNLLLAPVPALAKQTLTIGGAVSAAFNPSTAIVRITTTATCRVVFGAAPTGAGDTMLVYAGQYNDFAVISKQKVIAVAA